MRSLLVAIVLACGVGVVHADDKPWAEGVAPDKQRDALALYQKGNGFFEQAQYKEALAQYEQALTLWDHPAIRYNAAICLFNMDRPVEAYENLLSALRFGEPPLGKELYQQGLNYKKLLGQQVATLEVKVEDHGAKVSLDGKHLFDAPGTATRTVTTRDSHQILAAKPGYETEQRVVQLRPGETTTLVLKLRPLASARKLERRWAKWKPWAVIATGAAVGVAGVPFYLIASDRYDRYDSAVRQSCNAGCTPDVLAMRAAEEGLTEEIGLEPSAKRFAAVSYSLFAIGGAGVAAGFVLVLLNQPRLAPATVTPTVGTDRVGLTISAPW